MLDQFFTDPHDLELLRRGSLGNAVDDLASYLQKEGYCPAVARSYLSIAGHFSRWLALEGIAPTKVRAATLTRFRDEHLLVCRCVGRRGMRTHVRATLNLVLKVLRNRGELGATAVEPAYPLDQILCTFDRYLDRSCGAAPATRRQYTRYARGFLDSCFGAGAVDLGVLKPKIVIDFISKQTRERTPGTAKAVRTALRSLFRFAQLEGLSDGTLAAAVPRVARWKRAQLPRALSDRELAILLNAFDRSSVLGRRDYVITLCLAQLGLRAGEVAVLSLDDFDWRSGTLQLVRGKERRASILPLPRSLGQALVNYLRKDRPPTRSRRVFVRSRAPFDKPLASSGVSAVVRRAFARAGLGVASQGAHVLRHTAATRMVRGGASLKEVADVLRHRSLETTMIYTKLDLPTLAAVAHPWPEVQS